MNRPKPSPVFLLTVAIITVITALAWLCGAIIFYNGAWGA